MKTFNDSKSQHLEELEALISSSLSEKEQIGRAHV